jgi:hypothetical protein
MQSYFSNSQFYRQYTTEILSFSQLVGSPEVQKQGTYRLGGAKLPKVHWPVATAAALSAATRP